MKKTIKWIAIIFIALIIIGLIFGGDDKAKTDATTVTASETKEDLVAIPVTASALFKAYEKNEIAADQEYKGKKLEVSGKVESIDSDINDEASVKLSTSTPYMTVSAEGNEAFTEEAATLSKGQDIKMICTGAGEVIGFPELEDCVIQ